MEMSRGSTESDCAAGEIMLFGFRVKVDPMRKSVSMNNLSQYVHPQDSSNVAAEAPASGYASADEAVHHQTSGNRERKRGVPWTEEEHKLFLLGLQKVGKGDWRGISRNFVKTRTPTQVASHAQKYFLRRSNLNRRRRRSSLFDITTESVNGSPMEDEQVHQERKMQKQPQGQISPPASLESSNFIGSQVLSFPMTISPILVPVQGNLNLGQPDHHHHHQNLSFAVRPVTGNQEITAVDSSPPLSLNLSLSNDRVPTFQFMGGFNNNGDNFIRVA